MARTNEGRKPATIAGKEPALVWLEFGFIIIVINNSAQKTVAIRQMLIRKF